MQPSTSFIQCVILTFTLSLFTTSAINYHVTDDATNTPGGIRFTKEIGISYTKHKMREINKFIWYTLFQQNDPSDQKPLDDINVYIVEFDGAEAITWGNNNINDYAPPGFAKPGQGDRWDQGYDFTARFLEYCDGIIPGFVAKFNKMIRTDYDVSYFKDLTGKSVKQLWKEYKAKYEN
ncbi:uncharacterized protein [Rutidosis leptorrhynchoides]|uniref:uncharacterized protein n=1 Tax=Rutidosis leptorrhynchoides TaxID=125765 RepID=UPI003A99738D